MGSSLDAATGTSPGVRLREDLSYEPMLHVGLEHGGSLGEQRFGADRVGQERAVRSALLGGAGC